MNKSLCKPHPVLTARPIRALLRFRSWISIFLIVTLTCVPTCIATGVRLARLAFCISDEWSRPSVPIPMSTNAPKSTMFFTTPISSSPTARSTRDGATPPSLLDAADAAAVGGAAGGGAPSLAELAVGDTLLGVVKNIVDFGAFVDIGIGTDGLLHSSEMRRGRGRAAAAPMQVGTQLRVKVKQIEIQDLKRKKARIGLAIVAEAGE